MIKNKTLSLQFPDGSIRPGDRLLFIGKAEDINLSYAIVTNQILDYVDAYRLFVTDPTKSKNGNTLKEVFNPKRENFRSGKFTFETEEGIFEFSVMPKESNHSFTQKDGKKYVLVEYMQLA